MTFRGGFVADWAIVTRLLALEARGARFSLLSAGRFRVEPPSVLTSDDIAFLRCRRDEVRALLEYQANDAHLFSDTSRAQALRLPGRAQKG